jgi:hypothetical protein
MTRYCVLSVITPKINFNTRKYETYGTAEQEVKKFAQGARLLPYQRSM